MAGKADAGIVIGVSAAIAAAIALLRQQQAGAAPGNILHLDEATMSLLIAIAEQTGKIDDILEALEHCKTAEQTGKIDDILEALEHCKTDEIITLLRSLIPGAPGVSNRVTRLITLRALAVPAGRGVKISDFSPVTGKITQVLIHWPPGVNGLVDVAVGHGSIWVVPTTTRVQSESYIALDATSILWNIDEPVKKNEQLWIVVRNRDALNPHTITAVISTIGEE